MNVHYTKIVTAVFELPEEGLPQSYGNEHTEQINSVEEHSISIIIHYTLWQKVYCIIVQKMARKEEYVKNVMILIYRKQCLMDHSFIRFIFFLRQSNLSWNQHTQRNDKQESKWTPTLNCQVFVNIKDCFQLNVVVKDMIKGKIEVYVIYNFCSKEYSVHNRTKYVYR